MKIYSIETTYQHFDADDKPIDKYAYTRHIEVQIGEEKHEINCRRELDELIEQLNELSVKCWGE